MQDNDNSELPTLKRVPWNKGKLIGAKPPLRQKHVLFAAGGAHDPICAAVPYDSVRVP